MGRVHISSLLCKGKLNVPTASGVWVVCKGRKQVLL